MTLRTFFLNSTDENTTFDDHELQALQSLVYTEGVFGDRETSELSFEVQPTNPNAKTVQVTTGRAFVRVTRGGETFNVFVRNEDIETLTLGDNSSGTDRIDTVVLSVDVTVQLNELKNNASNIQLLEGNTSGTVLSDDDIDTAIGHGNWIRLADVTASDSFTTIAPADIDNRRIKVTHTRAVDTSDPANRNLTDRDTSDGGFDQVQSVQDVAVGFSQANSANNNNQIAQSFIPNVSGIRGVHLYKREDVGDFNGIVRVEIQTDNSDEPSGDVLASYEYSNVEWGELAINTFFVCLFDEQYDDFVQGTKYWIVLSSTSPSNTNHPRIGGDNNTTYTGGQAFSYNQDDGWPNITNTALSFRTLSSTEEKVVKTGENGRVPSHMLGTQIVYTDFNIGDQINGNSLNGDDWHDYLSLNLADVWELYVLLKIKIFLEVKCTRETNHYQKMKMLFGSNQVFDLNISNDDFSVGGANAQTLRGVVEINIQCSNQINEHVTYTQSRLFANQSGDETDHYQSLNILNEQNSHATITDLASLLLKVQVKNNDTDSAIYHRRKAIIVEKSIVENQHRQHYPIL